MAEEIPQWALDKVARDAGFEDWEDFICDHECEDASYKFATSLARYIAKHEQPPVDPDLVKAREICARVAESTGDEDLALKYRSSRYDAEPEVQFTLSALKEARG